MPQVYEDPNKRFRALEDDTFDDKWTHRRCEECKLVTIDKERGDQWWWCGQCDKLMCQDCMSYIVCGYCEDPVCKTCQVRCRRCIPNLVLHRECVQKHRANCNTIYHAEKVIELALEREAGMSHDMEKVKNRYTDLSCKREELKKIRATAERVLQQAETIGESLTKKQRV